MFLKDDLPQYELITDDGEINYHHAAALLSGNIRVGDLVTYGKLTIHRNTGLIPVYGVSYEGEICEVFNAPTFRDATELVAYLGNLHDSLENGTDGTEVNSE